MIAKSCGRIRLPGAESWPEYKRDEWTDAQGQRGWSEGWSWNCACLSLLVIYSHKWDSFILLMFWQPYSHYLTGYIVGYLDNSNKMSMTMSKQKHCFVSLTIHLIHHCPIIFYRTGPIINFFYYYELWLLWRNCLYTLIQQSGRSVNINVLDNESRCSHVVCSRFLCRSV